MEAFNLFSGETDEGRRMRRRIGVGRLGLGRSSERRGSVEEF